MFLHIGNSKILFNYEIIGIFNTDPLDKNTNKHLLETASYDALNVVSGHNKSRSFIVTEDEIYLSPISPLTLSKRHNSSR